MLRCETCQGIWAGREAGNPGPPDELPPTPQDGQELLRQFRKLAQRLDKWRTQRGEEADAERAQIAKEIRKAYAEGQQLGIYGREMADALNVSRQRLYQIIGDVQQVRTRPRRGMLLVALTESQRDALLRAATGSADPELAGAVTALKRGRAVTLRAARQAVGQ